MVLKPMIRFSRLGRSLLLGVFLWTAFVPGATAQQTHTLTIRDGSIFVDGTELSTEQLPSDLDVEGVTAQYRFVGIQQPVIELNGRLFAVKNGLQPVSEEEVNGNQSSVILQEIKTDRDAPSSRAAEGNQNPQKEYLNEVQKANRELYKKLVRERTLEQEAQELAQVIRMLPEDTAERATKIDSLQALLNTIFDLKQENRRREIERLQREIQEVQRRVQKRRQMREEMIEHRLNQLLRTGTE